MYIQSRCVCLVHRSMLAYSHSHCTVGSPACCMHGHMHSVLQVLNACVAAYLCSQRRMLAGATQIHAPRWNVQSSQLSELELHTAAVTAVVFAWLARVLLVCAHARMVVCRNCCHRGSTAVYISLRSGMVLQLTKSFYSSTCRRKDIYPVHRVVIVQPWKHST